MTMAAKGNRMETAAELRKNTSVLSELNVLKEW
jgi:hypothetical protein